MGGFSCIEFLVVVQPIEAAFHCVIGGRAPSIDETNEMRKKLSVGTLSGHGPG